MKKKKIKVGRKAQRERGHDAGYYQDETQDVGCQRLLQGSDEGQIVQSSGLLIGGDNRRGTWL